MGHGQVGVLHARHADAHAKQAARAKGVLALGQLVAVVVVVLEGVEHDLDAPERVGVLDGEKDHARQGDDADKDQVLSVKAGKEEHGQQRHADDHGGALVGLDHDEGQRQDGGQDAVLDELSVVDGAVVKALLADARRKPDDADLGKLGGLQLADEGQVDPAARAVG